LKLSTWLSPAFPVGAFTYSHGLEWAVQARNVTRETVSMYLQAFTSNLVSAAIRLVPLGQTEGQKIIAALHPVIASVADEAMNATLDDIGGCTFTADIASMRHETQSVRLFRS